MEPIRPSSPAHHEPPVQRENNEGQSRTLPLQVPHPEVPNNIAPLSPARFTRVENKDADARRCPEPGRSRRYGAT